MRFETWWGKEDSHPHGIDTGWPRIEGSQTPPMMRTPIVFYNPRSRRAAGRSWPVVVGSWQFV